MEPKQEEVTPDRRGGPRDGIRTQQEATGVLAEKQQSDDSKSEQERQRQEAIAQTGDSGGVEGERRGVQGGRGWGRHSNGKQNGTWFGLNTKVQEIERLLSSFGGWRSYRWEFALCLECFSPPAS